MSDPAADGDDAGGAAHDSADGEVRRGRRGNGLSALTYVVLTHCEPQIADGLLKTLASEGIAAYAVPYAGSVGGYLEMHPPARPLARVWVDAAALAAARVLLHDRHAPPPEPPAQAEESAWQEIVASLRRAGPEGPAPWPRAEDMRSPPLGRPATRFRTGPAGAPSSAGSSELDHPVTSGYPSAGSDGNTRPGDSPPGGEPDPSEEHFVPPAPPPVPRPSGASAYGIAAMVGGFTLLLVPTIAGDPVGPALMVIAIAAIVGGFATLVARMREGPPTDSGPDDGAVV